MKLKDLFIDTKCVNIVIIDADGDNPTENVRDVNKLISKRFNDEIVRMDIVNRFKSENIADEITIYVYVKSQYKVSADIEEGE